MRKLALVLLLFSGFLFNGVAMAAQQWRIAIEEIKGSVQDAYAQKFKQLMEQKTGGEVKITVYPYGALGTSQQITELVQDGAVQFAFASPGHLGSVVPEVQIFSLQFLFPQDDAITHRMLSSSPALYKLLGQAYNDKELKLLDIVPEGWMVWTGNRPLRTPADFKGFKIRTMVSPLLLDAYKAYGANPTPMPYSGVYSGLQLHMIDGQTNPLFAIQEMHFYEVQKYMTFAKHLPFVTTFITNPDFYASLSPKVKKALAEVKPELDAYINQVQQQRNEEALAAIKKDSKIKLIHLTEKQRDAFRKLSLPVRQKYVQMAGPRGKQLLELLEQERKAAEAAAKK